MQFSSQAQLLFVRFMQLMMLLISCLVLPLSFPISRAEWEWYLSLILFEVLALTIVRGELTPQGLCYQGLWWGKQIPWDQIAAVRVWPAANALIVTIKGRSLVSRYKLLPSSEPNVTILTKAVQDDESLLVARLRGLTIGSIW